MEFLTSSAKVLVLVFLIQCKVVLAAFPAEVTIGGIFDRDDGGSYSASELAFNIAVNDVNSDGSTLTGVTLKGIVNTTTALDIKQSVASLCEQLHHEQIVALIGPSRSTVVKATNYICSGVGLPQIAYAASDPSLFSGHQQYPSLIRTGYSGNGFSAAILELMSYYQWKKAAMLVSSDDYGSSALQYIHESSRKKGISIVKTETFPALENATLVDFESSLLSIRSLSINIVILNCPGKYAKRIFNLAESLGMMSPGWVWIVGDAVATEGNLYDGVVPPMHIQGILGVVPSQADLKNKASFEAKWASNGRTPPINAYVYNVYDAVWTVARALNDMKVNGDNLTPPTVSCVQCDQNAITKWPHGQTLLEKIKAVEFDGELHRVKFDNDGTVLGESFDFVNLKDTGFEQVGFWDSSSGLQVNTSKIIWPGVTSNQPKISSFLLRNKTLEVVTMPEPPFVMERKGNFTGNDRWEGYSIDMLNAIAEELGFFYILHNSYDGNWGGKNEETQEWNGMVEELATGKSNLAVSAFTITSLRQQAIDFTIPYMDLGLTVIMKKKTREKGLLAFMDPFTNDVWFLLFCSTMYVGFVISVCSILSPYGYYGECVQVDKKLLTEDESDDLQEEKNNMRLDEAAWFSMGSLLGQGTDHQPRAISGKVVAAMWWMTGTIFVSTYTANLAAFLTVNKSAIDIRSFEDLANQDEIKYGTVKDTQPSMFFERSNIPIYQKMWSRMKSEGTLTSSSSEALARVQDGDYAFVWDTAVLEYVSNQQPCNTFVLNDLISPLGYGIGLPLNSPYKDIFSAEILKLRENGYLDKLKSEWFVQKGQCRTTVKKSKTVTVELPDVLGVYFLVTSGIVLGFFALIFEWIYFTRKVVNKEDTKYPTYKEAFKARLSIVWKDIKTRWISKRPVANPQGNGQL